MKILFLSLIDFNSLDSRGIYTDLLREFIKNGHEICVVSPIEKRKKLDTHIINDKGCKILKLKIGNIQKTNLIEKGISTIMLDRTFINGIKKYYADESFDLVLYATPPVTFQRVVDYVKKRDGAKSYLLLKDIWPQGAVDMQALTKNGLMGFIYKYFKIKEERMYSISDFIGCMSQANIDYLLEHNPTIQPDSVEICPNSIEPVINVRNKMQINKIRSKYNIPLNKTIFIYGGNLGKPQGIAFILECLESNIDNEQMFFVIVGSGTEFGRLKRFFDTKNPANALLFQELPKLDYDFLVNSCDVGLIFLDPRFTIPNFPSRLLSYMQAAMPVLAATDTNTDIGDVIEKGGFGYWCKSGDLTEFNSKVQYLCNPELRKKMGVNARIYLENNYTAKQSYEIIIKHFK